MILCIICIKYVIEKVTNSEYEDQEIMMIPEDLRKAGSCLHSDCLKWTMLSHYNNCIFMIRFTLCSYDHKTIYAIITLYLDCF